MVTRRSKLAVSEARLLQGRDFRAPDHPLTRHGVLCYRALMIRVECLVSGAADSADPAVIWFGARRVEVHAVTDRWFGSDQRWWKIETIDGSYIVRLDESTGSWELAAVVRE
jgi:hypothetical protein